MTEEQDKTFDFAGIDPTNDQPGLDQKVASIMDAARFELARRRKQLSALIELGRWQKPMAAAAVLAVIVSFSVSPGQPDVEPIVDESDYLGLPAEVADWVASEEVPSAAEILFAVEEVGS